MSDFKQSGSNLQCKSLEEEYSGPIPDPAICLQQGDRVCYNDIGNKEIVKKIEDISATSQESVELGSIRSGESLFKTFTFDIRQDSDPDMKKCLAFWKTILEKNVKPVKCSFLRKKSGDKAKREKPPTNDVFDSEEMLQKWTEIYKDLQRRKLDKIKLTKKQKCEPCEDYIDEEYEKKQEKEDIKKLNEWTSQKENLKSETLNAQLKRTVKNPQSNKEEDKQSDQLSAKKDSRRSSRVSSKVSIFLTPAQEKSQTSKLGSVSLEETTPSPTASKELIQTIEQPPEILEKPEMNPSSSFPVVKSESTAKIREIEGACGVPCDCAPSCTCQPRVDNADTCTCGCATADCVCREIQNLCMCGCLEDECVCEQSEECVCGCGLDECICQELSGCKCGHEDCECDLIRIMSTYLDTKPPAPKELQQSKTVQTVEEERRVEVSPRAEGASYCVICGHYNCFCHLKKPQ